MAAQPVEADKPQEQEVQKEETPRDRWSGRVAFVLAAVGSAVGLGNFWRFPYLVFKHGGGPFLIPYWAALLVLGIPMLLLELGMGQRMQAGDIDAFGRIHPAMRGVGVASVFAAFLVVSYYSVIIAYAVIYFVESWYSTLPWAPWAANATGEAFGSDSSPCLPKPMYHFLHETLHLIKGDCTDKDLMSMEYRPTVSGPLYAAVCFVWVAVGMSIFLGPRSASRVILVSVPLPFIVALVLFFRAVTLDGAQDGIDAYIGNWEWDKMKDPQLWIDAVSQIFFTLSVCFGVMTSYGSYRPKNSPVIANVIAVSVINCAFSFFCGFIVFGALGHMAHTQTGDCRDGCPVVPNIENSTCWTECRVEVADVAKSSIGLTFWVIPEVLATFSGSAANAFSVLTFLMLVTLGWDSAFSLVEAVTTVVLDAPLATRTLRETINDSMPTIRGMKPATPLVTFVVCAAGMVFGLLFASESGLYWLDLMDHYLNSYTLLLDGAMQAIAVTWVWALPSMCQSVGYESTMWFTGGYAAAGIAFTVITTALSIETAPHGSGTNRPGVGGELPVGFVAAFAILMSCWVRSFTLSRKTVGEWFSACVFAGADELMDFCCECGADDQGVPLGKGKGARDFFGTLFRIWWSVMMKYVTPVLLTVLCIIGLKVDVNNRYSGYGQWMQNVGWIIVWCSLVIFFGFIGVHFARSKKVKPEVGQESREEMTDAAVAVQGVRGIDRDQIVSSP